MTRYAGVELVSLIERESGYGFSKRANHYLFGPEYWGPCPFCKGGENRFHIWPEGDRPHYWCRVCDEEGSPAQFLMDYRSLTFPQALEELGIEDSEEEHEYHPPTIGEQMNKNAPPPKKWQEAAMLLVERAERYLWHPQSPHGPAALAYLHRRGLTDETIKKARLGYVPLKEDGGRYQGEFEKWGIDPDKLREDQRAKGGVRVPDGILIPWLEGDRLWKLCMKRPFREPWDQVDYGQVMGSSDGGLYNVDTIQFGQPAMMVESELCALSVMQVAGDLVNVVATGSAKKGRSSRLASDLVAASCILQSFDADQAGDEGSEYWMKRFQNCTRWRPWADETSKPARFKDPNDALMYAEEYKAYTGGTLREWVQDGVDGGSVKKNNPFLEIKEPEAIDPAYLLYHLLYQIYEADADLTLVADGNLRLHGAVPRVLLDQLKTYKPALVELLTPLCSVCTQAALLEPCEDVYYCEQHHLLHGNEALDSLRQARVYVETFNQRDGYYLRLCEDGKVAIGVPATLSDEEFERIAEEVCCLGEPLLEVIRAVSPMAEEKSVIVQSSPVPLARDITADNPPASCKKCRKKDFHHNLDHTGWVCLACGRVHNYLYTHVPEAGFVAQTSEQFLGNVERKAHTIRESVDWKNHGFAVDQGTGKWVVPKRK